MKALLSRVPGGPETLTMEEVPEPVPARGEVRVAVKACSVNFPDVLVIRDLYQFKPPRPFSPGAEASRGSWMRWERASTMFEWATASYFVRRVAAWRRRPLDLRRSVGKFRTACLSIKPQRCS